MCPAANRSLMLCQFIYGFSIYSSLTLLPLFFLNQLHFSEAHTLMVMGFFSSLGPLFSVLGGYASDRWTGCYVCLLSAFILFFSAMVSWHWEPPAATV